MPVNTFSSTIDPPKNTTKIGVRTLHQLLGEFHQMQHGEGRGRRRPSG
jgi:hypothetical protein